MKGKPSQCDLLLQHLKEHGSITGAEAFEKLGIGNLYDMEEIDQERMIEQIEKWGDTIDTVATENDALRKLEEVYNYRKRQKVYFVSHYKELQNQK